VAGDLAADAALIAEYAAVAVSDYGRAVLAAAPAAQASADGGDSTARLGRELLLAIFGPADPGGPLPVPLAGLAARPGDEAAAGEFGARLHALLAARPALAAQVRGMLPHCGLTLVMSRQRRAAAAAGERILPGPGPAADNEPRGG